MSYKSDLLNSTNNSFLGYIGAAVLGCILSLMFNLVLSNQMVTAIVLYTAYMIFIVISQVMCEKNIKYLCQFNEFWYSLEQLIKNKLNK